MADENSARVMDCDHILHVYNDDDGLCAVVAEYLADGLWAGYPTLIIATAEHRMMLRDRLEATGFDIAQAADDGRWLELDAADALASIMVGDSPDASKFDAVIGARVRDALATDSPVRAYGEMVDLLWSTGNACGAVELERLWNHLGASSPLTLLCTYKRAAVTLPATSSHFAHMCELHSSMVAGAPTPRDAERSRRFAGTEHDPAAARRFVTDVLVDWRLEGAANDSALIVSELATNALRHAGADFTVSVSRVPGGVQIAVGDTSPQAPVLASPEVTDCGGRGLTIVRALAAQWGHGVEAHGKTVWANVAYQPRRSESTSGRE